MARTRRSKTSAVRISPIARAIGKAKAAQAKAKRIKGRLIINNNNNIKSYRSVNKSRNLIRTKPNENNLIQTSPTDVLNISKGRQIKYSNDKDHLSIEITCTANSNPIRIRKPPITKKRNRSNIQKQISKTRTLCDDFQTIDCADGDESDDVIFVNDYHEDSDVIFVNELLGLNETQDDKSVIVIEDDTVDLSTPKMAKANPINITLPSPIPCNKVVPMKKLGYASSTPVNSGLPPKLATSDYIPLSGGANPFLFKQASEFMMNHGQIEQPEDALSTSRFGDNFLNGGDVRTTGLRPIFIDGSNIAISHSNTTPGYFSVKGLKICIDYFKLRGHEVLAIVPMFRKIHHQNSDPMLLQQLEKDHNVVFTPSRRINGRNIVPYDDRYIVLVAHIYKGIVVSSDNFRDLLQENPNLLDTLENRVLSHTWIKDLIIFPSDPLGRHGPKLDEFLRFP